MKKYIQLTVTGLTLIILAACNRSKDCNCKDKDDAQSTMYGSGTNDMDDYSDEVTSSESPGVPHHKHLAKKSAGTSKEKSHITMEAGTTKVHRRSGSPATMGTAGSNSSTGTGYYNTENTHGSGISSGTGGSVGNTNPEKAGQQGTVHNTGTSTTNETPGTRIRTSVNKDTSGVYKTKNP